MKAKVRARNLAFLVRQAPVGSAWTSEALRVAVGMTLVDGNRLTVVFLGPGVLALAPLEPERVEAPEILQHLETLREVGVRLVAEEEACARHGVSFRGVETADREALVGILAESEVLFPW